MRFGVRLQAAVGQYLPFALECVGKGTQFLSGVSVVAAVGQVQMSSSSPGFAAPCPVHWSQGLGKPLPFVCTV